MSVVPAATPAWGQDAFVDAIWVATGETPEWIASRTDAMLSELRDALDIPQWDTWKGDRWQGDPATLAAIVRNCPVRESVAEGVDGDPVPGEGYSLVLMGSNPSLAVNVWIHAGSVALGRRVPAHHLKVELRQKVPGAVTSDVGDIVCSAVARTWNPSTVKLSDSETNRAARRGGWKIGIGYRTWISASIGPITTVAQGLVATELAHGTMISAPDEWPPSRVVETMTQTIASNGLDDIPH